eukprot:scaffold55574_cov45-Cyclotella_meneghiniana.AAC.2
MMTVAVTPRFAARSVVGIVGTSRVSFPPRKGRSTALLLLSMWMLCLSSINSGVTRMKYRGRVHRWSTDLIASIIIGEAGGGRGGWRERASTRPRFIGVALSSSGRSLHFVQLSSLFANLEGKV